MPKRKPTRKIRRGIDRGVHEIIVRVRALGYVVYWLFDDTCFDPTIDGYVGSTGCPIERINKHMHNPALPIGGAVKFKILFRGSKRECLTVEGQLRPTPGIGWNVGPGVAGHANRRKPRRPHRTGFRVTP